ncbi:MAG: macro domain-containing protein [Granulosicoccaceae bacterium]
MQFLYGDRELLIQVADLFAAPVDVIVNPANGNLSHGGGIAGQVVAHGGEIIQRESDQFIKEHGPLESGMVAMTSAGALPYQAILHAVGPRMGEGDEQEKLTQAISSCLKLCQMHDWQAIAFPAISAGIFRVPLATVARGFYRAITSFWDARDDGAPEKIMVCLTQDNFEPFVLAFREASMMPDEGNVPAHTASRDDSEIEAGMIELVEEEIAALEDDEMNEWFKKD